MILDARASLDIVRSLVIERSSRKEFKRVTNFSSRRNGYRFNQKFGDGEKCGEQRISLSFPFLAKDMDRENCKTTVFTMVRAWIS